MTGSRLKTIGIVSMTLDHIGCFILPQLIILRIIGRIAFPIFAFFIAEGCRHTHNRRRYFLILCLIAMLCGMAEYIAERSLYQSVFMTFACSVALIFTLDAAKSRRPFYIAAAALAVLYFVLFELRPIAGLETDYGFFGIMLPVLVWLTTKRGTRMLLFSAGLLLIAAELRWVQIFSLLAVPLLCLYNGERGKNACKWFFYAYYPLHLAVIYAVAQVG